MIEETRIACPQCGMTVQTGERWCGECAAEVDALVPAQEVAPLDSDEHDAGRPSSVTEALCLRFSSQSRGDRVRRLHLQNNTGAEIKNLVVHVDGSPSRRLASLADQAELILGVPGNAQLLVASAQHNDARLCSSWQIGADAKVAPTVRVKGAGKMGKVVINAKGGEMPVIEAEQAGDMGDVEVHYEADAAPTFQHVAVQHEELQRCYPDWLCDGPLHRLRVFTGETLALGRDRRCEFPIYAREEGGRGIIAVDTYGSRVIISEQELNRRDVKFPVSRRHVSLRWSGGKSILAMDGSSKRPSKRGVFNGRMRLDPGWNSLPVPVQLNLGRKAPRVELQIALIDGPRGSEALAIRQVGTAMHEVLLWTRSGDWVGFAENPSGGWCPTWCADEAYVKVQVSDGIWRTTKTAERCLLSAGANVCTKETEYRVVSATHELLQLDLV